MIIAITGPAGAGKDTAAAYLEKKFGIPHISGGDILREMLTSLGLEPRKAALGPFGTFLRTQYGADIIIKMGIAKAKGGSFVANGFRSPAEATLFKESGAFIIYIDAPEGERHERIGARARGDDVKEIHLLRALDDQERGSQSPVGENLEDIRPMADVVIVNDGSLEDLYEKLDNVSDQLEK
jgi:adenylate kinase